MHGSYGSPQENWFPWLKKELEQRSQTVILKQFPVDDWDAINRIGSDDVASYQPIESLASWETYFLEHVLPQIGDEPFVFIGHSIAPIFMLHMLKKYPLQLAGAIFVAPFFDIPTNPESWQFYPVNKTFYSMDFDFDKIKEKIGKSYVVYGDDDPYVPVSEPVLFAEKLGSEIFVVKGGGHCGSIFKEFPLVLNLVKKLIT